MMKVFKWLNGEPNYTELGLAKEVFFHNWCLPLNRTSCIYKYLLCDFLGNQVC